MSNIQVIQGEIGKMAPQFKKALPEHVSEEKFVRVVMTAISGNPKLADADRTSFFAACMKSAESGLMPNGVDAALVPFYNKKMNRTEVSYIKMIAGDLKLLRQSGELKSIQSQIIYKNDEFEYYVDESGEHLKHKPNMFGDRGDKVGAYAIAITKDGGVYIEVMTTEQINAVKSVSKTKDFGPWSGPFESEMWRKTVLKRICKRLPMSTDIEHRFNSDDSFDADFKDVTPETEIKKAEVSEEPEGLKQLIDDGNAPI